MINCLATGPSLPRRPEIHFFYTLSLFCGDEEEEKEEEEFRRKRKEKATARKGKDGTEK